MLKEAYDPVEFNRGSIEVGLVSLLFLLYGKAVLAQKRLDRKRARDLEQWSHQPFGHTPRRERNLERIKIKEKDAGGPLIYWQDKAQCLIMWPVFDRWYGYSLQSSMKFVLTRLRSTKRPENRPAPILVL